MMKNLVYIFLFLVLFVSCEKKENKTIKEQVAPIVSENGTSIAFPDTEIVSFFKTEKVSNTHIDARLNAPGKIAAVILPSGEGALQNIILFDNPDLAGNYTQLIQHQINIRQMQTINIRQKQIELERTKNLHAHGTATGQELLNVQTELSIEQTGLENERAALIEHEVKLKSAGFDPDILRKAKAGTTYIICDIPENQISKIKEGQSCTISFTAFPNKNFNGKIEALADMVDNTTRMIKVRILLDNSANKLKSGMFANVSFELTESEFVNISETSLVTVQGKHYVFVKKSANEFERREIQLGQQIGQRIVVFNGILSGDEIALEGVMQLKGLSFGY